jgi:hypothetical protein
MSRRYSTANMSVVSLQATALEVCDFVYGDGEVPTTVDTIDRFYESSASKHFQLSVVPHN